ncbi:BTB/POZ domain-containing protein NPY4-like [Dioscorea cayenensis subsp. rotundata]|uniref:BTB/POZ domain-containing protein NPY4-like n=1 Tax=Dioscorea cayennensis subsp. rotundata TaxID=55577 RepID=A0AB40CK00_DIOCR|nr:BTB/POZ domain-containing protein NPY4-like [Dioscorea cayenensis subsp. rotundata]XP_039140181.1 BTB/POZ domain-containing protein NPY4-like [Dioscorea cayenensis subsp. rotundata]XP_039140182.1 BTB/POZ domain-containing protein NPY4-like [Dioscorea cayenensis subsp. rotundata]XP_039140183.1 BTB/POZ domain-containing protein NPY4-like [Dioscorea cayenensis subsp. rotundata]
MKYMKLGSKPDAFQTDGSNVRFVAAELAADLIVNVGDVKFYLHKFPLLSKSPLLKRLVANTNDDDDDDEIYIPDIPGGPAAFEICAKFCYGMIVTLNAYNVVAARCAAEYLEMHETIEKGNLIYKIEVFLNSSIFRSWKDSIIVLQTTKSLLPWSEDLKVIKHCVDSIASKASINPSEVEWSYTYNRKRLTSENGIESQWNGVRKQQSVPKDWWVEDLCELEMDLYKQVIMAIKMKGRMTSEVIGEALKAYTYRRLSGFARGAVNLSGDVVKNRTLLETVIRLLPPDFGSVSCSFLLKLLKAACLLDCGEVSKRGLIKRIGQQLEEASVPDLLIPSPDEDTLYHVDIVMNIVEEFFMQENSSTHSSPHVSEEVQDIRSPGFVSTSAKVAVTRLVDGYLTEIAKDPNLPLSKFLDVAEMASGSSRPVHDALYCAIDMYLKEHLDMTKSEKKKICSLMDCKKLSADACMHAVQNERLPLRVVVQVLFFEQMRASMTGGGTEVSGGIRSLLPRENGGSYGSSRSAATTNTDDHWDAINTIKSMRLANNGAGSEKSSGSSDMHKNGGADKTNGKAKGSTMPKKILSKLFSSKAQSGENSSSSDTSESPGSVNPEVPRSTPSRNVRHSVS